MSTGQRYSRTEKGGSHFLVLLLGRYGGESGTTLLSRRLGAPALHLIDETGVMREMAWRRGDVASESYVVQARRMLVGSFWLSGDSERSFGIHSQWTSRTRQGPRIRIETGLKRTSDGDKGPSERSGLDDNWKGGKLT